MAEMLTFTFDVEMSDGQKFDGVVADIRDMLTWEKVVGKGKPFLEDGAMSATKFAYIAWHAMRRQQLIDMGWKEFIGGGMVGLGIVKNDDDDEFDDDNGPEMGEGNPDGRGGQPDSQLSF